MINILNKEQIIVIPSKGRPDIIQKRTLKFLEKSKSVYIVIEPQDYEDYKQFEDDYSLLKLDKNGQGLTYSRLFIQKHFEDKFRYIWMIDDNIDQFLVRKGKTSGGYPQLHKIEKEEIKLEDIFNETLEIMKENNYIQMTLSFRPTNWLSEKLIKEKTRSWGIVLNDNKQLIENNIFYDLKCILFQDLDIVAQIFKKRLTNACYHKYAFHKKMTHYKGGCNSYRNENLANDVCDYIKEKYGAYVSIRYNKKHNINEPVFMWKQLINASNEKNENKKLYTLSKYLQK